jgi:hypothetical protein
MAVVGSATVIVRAIGKGVSKDIGKMFKGIDKLGSSAGARSGASFKQAFAKVGRLDWGKIFNDAKQARERFQTLIRTGNTLGAVVVGLIGGIGALAGGLVALGGALLSATPAAIALLGGLTAIGFAAIAAKIALGGIGAAVGKLLKQQQKAGGGTDDTAAKRRIEDARRALALVIERNKESLVDANNNIEDSAKSLTDAQIDLNKALEEGNEQLQQLGFEAEDAAIAEQKAAVELERARETLLRVQDLPPNSRARREAELAFAEADLNLRKAKDRNSDLAKEQERLAETGVEGLDSVIAARETAAQAEERLQEARDSRSKQERDNARAQADAERNLARAQEDAAKAGGGGADDPLAGLTKSQKEFALFLASLAPQLRELKEAIAAAFLPLLTVAIQNLVTKGYATIETGLIGIGTALGNASISVSEAITDAENLSDLAIIFETSAFVIEGLGRTLGNIWGIFTSLLVGADGITRGFITFLEEKTGVFEEFLDTKQASGELQTFFDRAGVIAAQIGAIIGNTFGGIVGIVEANTGEGSGGQLLLDYLERITENFEKFAGSPEARQFFSDVAANAIIILDAVGIWVGEILKLGADPNIGVFFKQLGEAGPGLGRIGEEIAKALPAFGELILGFVEFIETFTQAEQITAFFDTLAGAIGFVNDVFQNEFVKGIIDKVAPVLGTLSAIGLILDVIKFAILVVAGNLLLGVVAFKALGFIGKTIFSVLKTLGGFLLNIARVVIPIVINGLRLLGAAFMANPIGFVIGLIALLVGAFIVAYNTSDTFRETVNNALGAVRDFFVNAWETIKGALMAVWDWLSENWPLLLAILTGPIGLAVKFIIDNWDSIVSFVKKIPGRIKDALVGVWDGITSFLKDAWTNTKNFFTTIFDYVKDLPNKMKQGAGKIWDFLIDGIKGAWQLVKDFWNSNIGGKGFSIGIPDWVPFFGGRSYDVRIPRLAKGGTVMPTPGGIIANIAEAGRPERVEPLDPDGLSKRDKAMIALLAGKQGGGQGMTFNIYPSQGMDENALAEMVSRKIAFMMRRGAVA